MPAKFQIGDIIVGNSQASSVYGFTGTGWIGKVVTSKVRSMEARAWNVKNGTYSSANNYPLDPKYFDLYVAPKPKRAPGGLILKDEMFFTANVGRKKIRGQVLEIDGDWWLANRTEGESESTLCDCGWNVGIKIKEDWEDEQSWEDHLQAAGVTNFQAQTDKRMIKIIEMDKCPEVAGYTVRKEDGDFIFGCGAVHVPEAMMKDIVKVKKAVGKEEYRLTSENEFVISEMSPKELKEAATFFNNVALIPAAVMKNYDRARDMANDQSEDISDIKVGDIELLLEFYS